MSSIDEVIEMIDNVIADVMVPKNVKAALEEAKKVIKDESKDISLRVSSAVYLIEKVSDEPNLMPHTRMDIWNILSALESLGENKKE